MKSIEIKGKKQKIGFTFNSFKYIEDLDLSELSTLESKPFKMFTLLSDMFYGAMNHDRSKEYDRGETDKVLESFMEEKSAPEILELLIEDLNNSAFFKTLQKK